MTVPFQQLSSTAFQKWYQSIAPTELDQPYGAAFEMGFASVKDYLSDNLRLVLKSKFPSICPSEALANLALERGIFAGPTEGDAAFAARLQAAWNSWPWAGTAFGVLSQLAALGYTNVILETCRGLQYALDNGGVNFFTFSQNVENTGSWVAALATITPNSAVGPDGTTTAFTILDTAGTGIHSVKQTVTTVIGQRYTLSCYAKAGTSNFIALRAGGVGSQVVIFDLSGAGSINLTFDPGSTGVVGRITASTFGFFRCEISFVSDAVTLTPFIERAITGNDSFASVGLTNLFAYPQFELGASATPYWPTYATNKPTAQPAGTLIVSNLPDGSWWIDANRAPAPDLNLLPNPSFEFDSNADGLANSWSIYNNSSGLEPATASLVPGLFGSLAQRLTWAVNNTTQKGFFTNVNASIPIGSGGVRGLWKSGQTYVISWWARASGTNIGKTMNIGWNQQPASTTILLNPVLTANFQQYAFQVTMKTTGFETFGALFATIISNSASQGTLDFDGMQVTVGSALLPFQDSNRVLAWAPSTLYPPNQIVVPSAIPWAPATSMPVGTCVAPTTSVAQTSFYYRSSGGTTGSSQPAWPVVAGGTVTDNGITWTAFRKDFIFVSPIAGTSGTVQPVWPTVYGTSIIDGSTLVWANSGNDNWSRFDIIFPQPLLASWGGTPPAYSSDEVTRIRKVIHDWAPAFMFPNRIIVITSGTVWGSSDGTWGDGGVWGSSSSTVWSPV